MSNLIENVIEWQKYVHFINMLPTCLQICICKKFYIMCIKGI